jgi:cytochrome c biogenesis protein CcmG/thiol:disulfide interchange protein DsbE
VASVTTGSATPAPRRSLGRVLLFLVPLLLFAAVGAFLAVGLTRDPQKLPSALIDKPAPEFSLPPLAGRAAGGDGPLAGRPRRQRRAGAGQRLRVLVHALPDRAPLLARLAEQGAVVHAINYKDQPEDAAAWLKELGDPYRRIGSDRDGRAGIEWGVYGVPETFVVDRAGKIVHKHVGPLMARDIERTILPLLEKLK